MQPADSKVRLTALAVELRRRSPWEATDLGLAMLQRWWRPVYAAHALVVAPLALLLVALGWAFDAVWAAMLVFWWLEPLYDRVVLHVLSRAVFGEIVSPRSVFAACREWTRGLIGALTLDRFDMARSFNLPVRQLEGSRGREARERRRLLGRRARGQAVWLTVVWLHFEGALLWSAAAMAGLLLPVGLERAPGGENPVLSGLADVMKMASVSDALIYAAVILFLEPFYVAAGFGLYLNRRTLLEGWDIEVALRRIAERHAAGATIFVSVFIAVLIAVSWPQAVLAQPKSPKEQITEVLKAPEFGHYRDTTSWERIDPAKPRDLKTPDLTFWHAIGYALAKAAEAALWVAAIAATAYALWWLSRRLPRVRDAGREAYEPPAALFGMELAPDTLPAEVPEAAARLAAAGKLRDALSLLYRGALSELVHKRGVRLLASHTEGEAVRLAGMPYFAALVDAWRRCAYASHLPSNDEVEQLTKKYREAFA
jgi:hypothetical protein